MKITGNHDDYIVTSKDSNSKTNLSTSLYVDTATVYTRSAISTVTQAVVDL